jgi:hypothetical protein
MHIPSSHRRIASIEADDALIVRSLLNCRVIASSHRVIASSQRANASSHRGVALSQSNVASMGSVAHCAPDRPVASDKSSNNCITLIRVS